MMLECYGSSLGNRLVIGYRRLRQTIIPFRRWIGIPLATVILFFIARELYDGWKTLGPAIRDARLSLLLIGLGAVFVVTIFAGWNWGRILRILGVTEPWLDILKAYFLANFARYMPGGIWHFAGRIVWLSERGSTIQTGMEGIALEQGMTLAMAVLVGLPLSGVLPSNTWPIAGLVGILLILLVSLIAISGRMAPQQGDVRAQFRACALLVLRHGVFWVIYGMGPVLFAAALVGPSKMTLSTSARVVGQAAIAWAAGYVVLLIPSGWGVRELVFANLLSQNFRRDVAILLPILVRLAQILVELLLGSMLLIFAKLELVNRKATSE